MVNVLLKEFVTVYFIRKTEDQRTLSVLIWITSAVMAIVLAYGAYRLSPTKDDGRSAPRLTVAVIQPNIPQELKWQESAKTLIIGKHIALSKRAAEDGPDLIIWPETSYPDYLWEERELFGQVQLFVRRLNIPVLLGSVVKEENEYYNTSILLRGTGEVAEIYRKTHLVPFGEFIPLRRFLPFLSSVIDIGDFTRGKIRTVFRFFTKDQRQGDFSVLICFEDTVARLSRQFVQGGAQWLINITNDAWFGNTKAPYMHLQSAVFRAVENRRALVRAANTGVSCFVDRYGGIDSCVKSQGDGSYARTYISGYAVGQVDLNTEETFYTKFGDVFAFLCFGCILMGIIVIIIIDSRKMSFNNKSNIIGRE